MGVIDFSTLDAQRSGLVYWFVFSMALGAILGGIWEQSTSGSSTFLPRSFKRILGFAVASAFMGLAWGYFSTLDVVYRFECRGDSVALWKANRSAPIVFGKSEIKGVVPGLASVKGTRTWEIHFYDKDGVMHASSRLDDRGMKEALSDIKRCLSEN